MTFVPASSGGYQMTFTRFRKLTLRQRFATVLLTGMANALESCWISRWLLLAVSSAAVLATFGCRSHGGEVQNVEAHAERSSATSEEKGSGHSKVCTLISPEELSTITKLNIANANSDDQGEVCNYTAADESTPAVGLQVDWEGGKFALQASSKLMENAAGGAQFRTPVAGIGDEAFVLGVSPEQQRQISQNTPGQLKGPSTLTTGPLMFRKNDVMVTVTANLIDNKFEAEKQIATKVAGRL
jgi:hypothetical protein